MGFSSIHDGTNGVWEEVTAIIKSCVSAAHFSILLNGLSKGYFKSSCGLRRGDPLSPMPFVIVVEVLNALLEGAKQMQLISGFVIEDGVHEVTHLQFADDNIIFCAASLTQVEMLKFILKWFEWLSGLKINYGKCELICVQLADSHVVSLANAFGCRAGKVPSKFLGLLTVWGYPKNIYKMQRWSG